MVQLAELRIGPGVVELAKCGCGNGSRPNTATPLEEQLGCAIANQNAACRDIPLRRKLLAQAHSIALWIVNDAVDCTEDCLARGRRSTERIDARAEVEHLLPGQSLVPCYLEDVAAVPYRHSITPATISTASVETA